MKIFALVVTYKTKLDQSDTLLSLARQNGNPGFDLLVWDNSPEEAGIEQQAWLSAQFNDVEYHHNGRNTPLSEVYNTIIKERLRPAGSKYDYLMLFDQDSGLSPDFLLKMDDAAINHPDIKLFLPLVRSRLDGILVSPANLYYFKGSAWKRVKLGLVKTRFTTAINSGMMISRSYLVGEFGGYSPEIPFYGTDNWLCQSVAKSYRLLCVVDTLINHDLAQFGPESNDVKLWRHRQNIRALRFLNREGIFRRNLALIYTFAMCVKRAIKYRDWRFLG